MNSQSQLSSPFPPKTVADVLIVDDVLENIRLLASILGRVGYRTRKATNGKMGLTAAEAVLPDLILLDIRMPDLNGYEVCKQLKSNPQTSHIPIIFLSAASEVSDKELAFQVGGADYITKPFFVAEVLARVEHQIAIVTAQKTISHLKAQLEKLLEERHQQLKAANL
jgi:PleD family two-component response regulator